MEGFRDSAIKSKFTPSRPIARSLNFLDLLLRELQFQSQRVNEAVSQVCQAGEHVEIDDLGIRKLFLELIEVRFIDFASGAGQLFHVN